MKIVKVFAANLRCGDVLVRRANQRIKAVHKYGRRCRRNGAYHKLADTGVLVVTPSPNGYDLDVFDFIGDEKVKIQRPKYNMGK